MPADASPIAAGLAILEYGAVILVALGTGFIIVSRFSKDSEPEDSGASPDASERSW